MPKSVSPLVKVVVKVALSVVVNAAYSPEVAEDGYASEVLDLGDDNYIVLRLKENFPSRQQSLDEVRDGLIDTQPILLLKKISTPRLLKLKRRWMAVIQFRW